MTKKSIDEKTLADLAYAAYLHGRMAGVVTAESPARTALVQRYSAPSRHRVEQYTFLYALRSAGCPLESPDELLASVYRELGMDSQAVAS